MYMNKNIVIVVAIVAIAIAVFFSFKALPTGVPGNEEATTTATGTSQTNTAKATGSAAPQAGSTAVQGAPASNATVSAGLQQAFAAQGSFRCEWVDKSSGAESLALIKNGKVRMESSMITGEKTIMLYTTAATYMWKDGEKTGVAVPKELMASTQLGSIQTRSEIESKLRTDDRVKCGEATLNDSHFAVPTDVQFQMIKG